MRITEEEWCAAGFPCTCSVEDLHVIHADRSQFVELCERLPEKAYGCFVDSSYFAPDNTIVYSPAFDPGLALIPHETAHFLSECSGLGADSMHSNPEIWGPGGVVQKANAHL